MSFSRPSGRMPDAMRGVSIIRNVSKHAEGSCLVKFGDTHGDKGKITAGL